MKSEDTYKTIASPTEEILFKEKNSKFFGYAFPISEEAEIKPILETLRKKFPDAGHFCYAYQIGSTDISYRANDDGEPSNSAGMPIYGQIQSKGLTNIIIVVIRYFGGTKLGVGGLISAYRTTAQMSLEQAEIIEKTIDIHLVITFDYQNINKVMRLIKEKNLTIVSQSMEMACEIEVTTRKGNLPEVQASFENLFGVTLKLKA